MAILSFLHINDNTNYVGRNQTGYDPLFKVRPFIDHLLAALKDEHSPGKELTIDEQICPFRGRINFRVYVKGKPHKYGIKFWMLCDAVTGLPINFEIYTGKSNDDL